MCRILVVSILFVWANLFSQSYSHRASRNCPPDAPLSTNLRVIAFASLEDDFYNAGPPPSGSLVDLLNAFTEQAGLTYTLTTSPAGMSVGNQNPDGTWDGSLVGLLINNEFDLILGMMTANSQRESVVDFLVPFSTYQIQIVYNTQSGLTRRTQYIGQNDANLAYLQKSQISGLQAIARSIAFGGAEALVSTNAEGLAKVLTGDFAYITESPFGDRFVAANPGRASVVPATTQRFFFSAAVQQGSRYREKLNLALLQLHEDGTIQSILNKYNLVT